MEIITDVKTITEAGFDVYLVRSILPEGGMSISSAGNFTDASSLVGGIIGSEGIMYLGSKQIKLDGKNRRIIIYDGVNSRVNLGQL